MALIRVHIGFTRAQLRELDEFAEENGLDRSNAVRYCCMNTIKAEKKKREAQDDDGLLERR